MIVGIMFKLGKYGEILDFDFFCSSAASIRAATDEVMAGAKNFVNEGRWVSGATGYWLDKSNTYEYVFDRHYQYLYSSSTGDERSAIERILQARKLEKE